MEPLELLRKRRPERPVNIILLLDVSGSMKPYARAFLAFARGLAGSEIAVEVFLFHPPRPDQRGFARSRSGAARSIA